MNLLWIALLAVFVLIEKLAKLRRIVGRIAGVGSLRTVSMYGLRVCITAEQMMESDGEPAIQPDLIAGQHSN